MNVARVYYDAECALCRSLAAFIGREAQDEITFVPQSGGDATETFNPRFKVITSTEQELFDADAWQWLIAHHPSLAKLHWLAAKLNLVEQTGALMHALGEGARRLCLWCKPW